MSLHRRPFLSFSNLCWKCSLSDKSSSKDDVGEDPYPASTFEEQPPPIDTPGQRAPVLCQRLNEEYAYDFISLVTNE